MNNSKILFRQAKITPKKIGQFVSVWKRNTAGITQPHEESDPVQFYIIKCEFGEKVGQFVFPKAALIQHDIISTKEKEGKRGFRIYPPWDKAENKQAIKSQKWQVEYFHFIDDEIDLKKAKQLTERL